MQRSRLTVLTACALLIAFAPTVHAEGDGDIPKLELTGVIRDFQRAHPDFERQADGYPLIQGMVKSTLGEDGRPVLNVEPVASNDPDADPHITVRFDPHSLYITSTKDLSNVVLDLSNGVEHKFDGLVGLDGTFEVPADYPEGTTIDGVWVKSANNASGDGPGYGEYFSPDDIQVPDIWRIESPETFDQWYRNVEGVNKSMKHTITLTDENNDGIFRYEASKHNGKSFFPVDADKVDDPDSSSSTSAAFTRRDTKPSMSTRSPIRSALNRARPTTSTSSSPNVTPPSRTSPSKRRSSSSARSTTEPEARPTPSRRSRPGAHSRAEPRAGVLIWRFGDRTPSGE